jgi:hypothetical protein
MEICCASSRISTPRSPHDSHLLRFSTLANQTVTKQTAAAGTPYCYNLNLNKMIRHLSRALRPLSALTALAAVAVALFGQATDCNIVGTIADATGSAVPKAKVVATNRNTNVKYGATSDSAGEYRLNNVPVGPYDVAVTAAGFAPKTIADVQADLNHTASVNVSLAVGSETTAVEVTEAPALIETSTSALQTTYNSNIAQNSPVTGISKAVNGAGIYNLSLLGAGVASSGGIGQGTGPSVAGQRPENNSFSIDGVGNNDPSTTGPQVYVSNEAVAEMNMAQNQFDAEFGGASGGVFNVIVKTGTNQFHGVLFEYFQNRNLNAVDYSEVVAGNRSNPRFDNNRFGAGVGGPVIKNKLFYYGNFEYNPRGQAGIPGNPVDAPTAAGIAILDGMSNLSKTNLGIFEKYVPVAQVVDPANPFTPVNGVGIPLGRLSFASPNYSNSYHAIVAVDYDLSTHDRLRGRYIYDKSSGIDATANLPAFFEPSPATNNSGSFAEVHDFSPTLENELRMAYRRNNAEISAGTFQFPGLSAFPNLSFDDLRLQVGPDPQAPQGQIGNTLSIQDNLTKTWGRHTIKIGYSINDVILSGFSVQRVRGDYDYASLGQFLLDQQPSGSAFGTPNSGERSAGAQNGVPFGFLQNAAYFQDDWRIRHNLTLNLGVRYEYVTVPVASRAQQYSSIADVPGVISFNAPQAGKNDWSPRLGFAYAPGTDGKWSIRGGVGRSFDNTYINLNEDAAPAYYQTTQDLNSAAPVSNFLANGGLIGVAPPQATAAQARAAISSYTWNQTRPYAVTGTLGVQRLLGKDYVVEARYVYTKGVHLWNQTRMNIVSPVTPANSLPTYFTMPSTAQLAADKLTLGAVESVIVPGGTATLPYNDLAVYGFQNALAGYNPWGNSEYNGMAVQMTKRYSKSFSYIAAYTWSHAFDDSTATNFSTILSPRRGQDFQDLRAEWASSALDRRQRVTLTPVYDFQPFHTGGWSMKNLLGNWTGSGTYTFQSPEYATVQDGIDANLNGDATGDRPITNPSGAANAGTAVSALNATGQVVAAGSPNIVAYVAVNPNARYVTAGLGALSNTGRNTLPLGRTNNIDVSLTKKLQIRERLFFQIGAQFFNLFNHSQFTGGYLSDVTPYITNAINRNVFVQSSSSFGQINQFFPSNSRQMSLVARFTF